MKYKEFKAEAEKLGLKVVWRSSTDYIVVAGPIEWIIASVDNTVPCKMNTEGYHAFAISEEYFRQLFHLLVKFSQTTIEERRYEEDD